MAEAKPEMVKVEIEIPKDQLKVVGSSSSEKPKKSKPKKKPSESSSEETTIGGYTPADILKAPLEEPEPKSTDPASSTEFKIIIAGFIVAAVGLFLWLFSTFIIGLAVALIGAAMVAVGTLGKF